MTEIGGAAIGAASALAGGVAKATAGAELTLAGLAQDTAEMRQASKIFAENVLIRQQFVRRLLKPVEAWVSSSRDYFETEFVVDLAAKTGFIPEESLVAPPPSIAVPAMQGLAYSKDESNLKQMYLALLATATDGRQPGKAHPSFAEIIKQLAPKEADILRVVVTGMNVPVVALRRSSPGEHKGFTFRRHLLPVNHNGSPVRDDLLPSYVDNWIRLGLVEVDYGTAFVREGAYDWADEVPEVVEARANCPADVEIVLIRGTLRVTDFGRRFSEAVGITPEPASSDAPRLERD